jgi:hypothetical protein
MSTPSRADLVGRGAPVRHLAAREVRVTPVGLSLRGHISFEQWADMGQRIARVASGSMWSLGDWLVYGETTYGARYRSALDATQFDYQTLRNVAWVARSFDMSRRRDALSFSHHAEVAALSQAEQDLWLARAQSGGWSRNELRRRLGAHYRRRPQPRPGGLRLELGGQREQRWLAAAESQHQSLADWVGRALDAAADEILTTGE